MVESIKSTFYDDYYKHFLLSNLPNVDKLYTPLSGAEFDTSSTSATTGNRSPVQDIQARIVSSLSSTDLVASKSSVVFGDGGTGKTTLALSIVHEFWKKIPIDRGDTDDQVIIPIYIHLSNLLRFRQFSQGGDILRLFINLNFPNSDDESKVKMWKILTSNHRLLLVLDGYESLADKRNLWKQNNFNEYNVRTITFSRPEALSDSEFDKTFSYECEGSVHKAKYYFLVPFSPYQISSYLLKVVEFLRSLDPIQTQKSNDQLIQLNEPWLLTKDVTKVNPIWERDSSEYRHWFELILPELGEVSQTPFILCLLVQILPTIVEEHRLKKTQKSFDMELIQLVSTEVGIYDQFTQKWFDYSSKKILDNHPKLREISGILPQLLEIYSNNLALRLFSKTQGFVGDGKFSRKLTEEWDLWKPNENTRLEANQLVDIDKCSPLFPESDEDSNTEKLGHIIALRSGCLLRYFHFQSQGGNYMFQFLHPSLFSYFVSRTIFKGLRAEINFHMKRANVSSTQFSFSFESIRSPKYGGILHMLVDRARSDSDFKNLLLSAVSSSKEISSLGLMSSNAFTILTHAYHVWCNEDFSYVNISEADMSHCIFVNCKFKGADMSRALLTGTFFYNNHLQAANLYHSHISRGLNLGLQEQIPADDRKMVSQFLVLETDDAKGKVQIIYRLNYGHGLSDLYVFDVNKKTSKQLIGSPKWSVLECRRLQQNPNVLLVALQPVDKDQSGQSLVIVDLRHKSPLNYLDQTYMSEKCHPHSKNVKLSIDDGNVDMIEIFTVPIPNHDEHVVCYRTSSDENISTSSFYYSLTTSSYPFNFTIVSKQKITSSNFSLNQSSTKSTLLATTSDEFVTVFDLQEEKIVFRKPFSPPLLKGQVVITFVRFSPDGKYLLFDMTDTLYILALRDIGLSGDKKSPLKEISLVGSKGGYDSMLSCEFSLVNSKQPLVALVYDHGTPLVIDLVTGQKLQSIKIVTKCNSLSFIGRDGQLQLTCASTFGSLSSHKIHFSHTGDPRSIQALNPRTDFHLLIDTKLEHTSIFLSPHGKYIAVITQQKHQFFGATDNIHSIEKLFCVLLFKIDRNTGKRTFVFKYAFTAFAVSDIQVSFINETFLCLMYPNEFKVFKCETPFVLSDCNDPIPVQISFGSNVKPNFKKSWYDAQSQQLIVQQNEPFVLEVCSVEISADTSSVLIESPRYRLDLSGDCSAAKVFFYTSDTDNFVYIFPFGTRLCYIWNLKSGNVLKLLSNDLGPSNNWGDVQNVSTIFVENEIPLGCFVDFSKGTSHSFQGVVNQFDKTLQLQKMPTRSVYQFINGTEFFLSFSQNSFFNFGIQPKSLFMFYPVHDVEGFQLLPVVTDSDNITSVRLIAWNHRSISCVEVNLSALKDWEGDKYEFTGWRLIWCDPLNDQFSFLFSNTTNTVVGRDENWNFLTKRFACEGSASRCLHSFVSLPSLFEQVDESPTSIFSKEKDLVLSNDVWILLVIAKKNGISASRSVNINVLQAHSGIIVEGIRHGRHFAFRADLFINSDKIHEITLAPLKRKIEKYFKLRKQYLATEFLITSEQGDTIINQILADKQSEVDYHLLYKNCNSWVKSLLALIGVDVDRKWSFVDLSNDFFAKKDSKRVLNVPIATVTGVMS